MNRVLLLGSVLLVLAAQAPAAVPPWVKSAAAIETPPYDKEIAAACLFDETVTSVSPAGDIRTLYRRATRLLTADGRHHGIVRVGFDQETRIDSLRAWSLPKGEPEFEVKGRDAIELAAFEGAMFADNRMLALSIPASEPGNVVAYEYEQRHRPYSLEESWDFQQEIPVRRARFVLTLPAGWTWEAHWVNRAAVETKAEAGALVWELSDVPEIRDESSMPSIASVAQKMYIRFIPPAGSALAAKSHRTWTDVGRWYASLADPRTAATPEIVRKANELTSTVERSLQKARALAEFAQRDVRYVAVEIGIGGYQPHSAAEVFTNRYGDCKDKVTLLRSMLSATGQKSYAVLVNTNRGAVTREFPALLRFNHMIAAIAVSGEDVATLGATIDHPRLGKLLMFDPTSTTTPFGSLPSYLQASEALLLDGSGGDIVDLGLQPAEANRLDRTMKLKLDQSGVLNGKVREVRSGWLASRMRTSLSSLTQPQQVDYVNEIVAGSLPRHTVTNLVIENLSDTHKELVVSFDLTAPGYTQQVGNLLLLRPRVLGQKGGARIDLAKRRYAYELEGASVETDDVEVVLPAGLAVDELPARVVVTAGPLSYTSESSVTAGAVHYRRQLKSSGIRVTVSQLAELNKLFSEIARDEKNSIVLK